MSSIEDMVEAAGKAAVTAGATAAGGEWNAIKPDVTSFAQTFVTATAQTAADLASGAITEGEAKVQFDALADYSAIVGNYATDALKAIAQAAFNAAIDSLWTAITKAIP
jgi:hypothetical protein